MLVVMAHIGGLAVRADDSLAAAQAQAMEPPRIITDPGPQYDDERRDVNMVIGIDRTPGGRLWACWVSGGDSERAYFVAVTSDDNGDTWSKPRLVINPGPADNGIHRRILVGNFWTDPTGKLWLFFDQGLGFFDGRAGAWATVCENPDADEPIWSTPRRIWHGSTLNKPIVLKDGTWLMPISLWQRTMIRINTEKHRPTTDNRRMEAEFKTQFSELDPLRGAHVFASSDKGKTWTRRGQVTFPHFSFDEHMVVELGDGRLWMLARTGKGIYESYSSDQGQTWTEPTFRFAHNSARHFLRRLDSGKLLLVKHGGIDERMPSRSHLTALLSDDDGQTWHGGLVLDERTGISYPDGCQSPDGTISIIYDRNRYSDAEILMARFREEDVLAKKFQSPDARARMLVSKATGKAGKGK